MQAYSIPYISLDCALDGNVRWFQLSYLSSALCVGSDISRVCRLLCFVCVLSMTPRLKIYYTKYHESRRNLFVQSNPYIQVQYSTRHINEALTYDAQYSKINQIAIPHDETIEAMQIMLLDVAKFRMPLRCDGIHELGEMCGIERSRLIVQYDPP